MGVKKFREPLIRREVGINNGATKIVRFTEFMDEIEWECWDFCPFICVLHPETLSFFW